MKYILFVLFIPVFLAGAIWQYAVQHFYAGKTRADEGKQLRRERDQWEERHSRERASHAKNLTEQQKVEVERNRLKAALIWCLKDSYWLHRENAFESGEPKPVGVLETLEELRRELYPAIARPESPHSAGESNG